jgi:hypothetical protein
VAEAGTWLSRIAGRLAALDQKIDRRVGGLERELSSHFRRIVANRQERRASHAH